MHVWAWASFFILGTIWGSSFLLIRVGVAEIPPTQLVLIRTTVAAIGLNTVLLLRGKRLPSDWRTWRSFALIGIGNSTIPFTLLGFGEQTVESNTASVLQSTVPLFSLVIAHFALPDEKITTRKVLGILIGFTGVLILASRAEATEGVNTLLGQSAVVGASMFYATFTVYSRTLVREKLEPIVMAAGAFIPASIAAFFFTQLEPLLGGRTAVLLADIPQDVLLSVFTLGFFNTFIAYLFFYFIVQQLGAFRATNVTYVVPVVGVLLGWLVLDESMDFRLLLGAGLIFTGLAVINLRRWRRARLQTAV